MEILERVKSLLPEGVVSRLEFEGSKIVVYTKNPEFLKTCDELVKSIVSQVKKRIEIRAEKQLLLKEEEARKLVLQLLPPEAGVKSIYAEPERSLLIIVAEKPGIVIGKSAETIRKLKKETFWSFEVERVPEIRSEIVEGIRKVLHTAVKFRKQFLNRVGTQIFSARESGRYWIRLIGLGGWGEVGRSCCLLETPKSKILVDCGVNVGGSNASLYPILNTKEFSLDEIDALVISHAHLDHVGFVPYLYEHGYQGPLYLTSPTLDLFALLCLDYIDVMQKGTSTPLYTSKGVREAVKHSITLDYGEVCDIAPDIRLTFQNAGHVLGSSIIHLNIGEGQHNLVYALDQKFGRSNLLEPAYTGFQRVETLILESTYGAKTDVMPSRHETEAEFMRIVNQTVERNGVVLIPSFSVERAQEIMSILVKYNFQHPVFIDGMIWDANGIFTTYPEYLSRVMQAKIFRGENLFLNPIFKRIASPSDREKAWEEKPCIIISTSGMLQGGPVLEHLKMLGEDPKNTLVFVGYQCENTLGRRIQKGWREIPLQENERTITLKLELEVRSVEGLSGHSDRRQLLAFVGRLGAKPGKIIVVHGEAKKEQEFAHTLQRIFRVETYAPKNLEAIRLR